jgi:hypothetical protein
MCGLLARRQQQGGYGHHVQCLELSSLSKLTGISSTSINQLSGRNIAVSAAALHARWSCGGPTMHACTRTAPEDAQGVCRPVRKEKGDGAVQAKGGVVQVLKHVQVVQAVRLCSTVQYMTFLGARQSSHHEARVERRSRCARCDDSAQAKAAPPLQPEKAAWCCKAPTTEACPASPPLPGSVLA